MKQGLGNESLILEMDLAPTIFWLLKMELQKISYFLNTIGIKAMILVIKVLILKHGIIGCLLMILKVIYKCIEMVNHLVNNRKNPIRRKFLEF